MNTTAKQPCKGISGNAPQPALHLYVHVPFCASLCHYCAFYSEPSKGETMNRYLDALEKELALWSPHLAPQTIFFGGGTPTLLNLKQLEQLLSTFTSQIPSLGHRSPPTSILSPKGKGSKTALDFGPPFADSARVQTDRQISSPLGGERRVRGVGQPRQLHRHDSSFGPPLEFTFESNPATLSLDKARLFRSFGVNRISMGVQSFDERVLDKLGRIHTPEQAYKSYEVLRQAGFDNVNLDLMFALPGQSMADWEQTLRKAIALRPEHISTYCLTLEEDTVFWRLFQEGAIQPNEDREVEMYERTWAMLDEAGYEQYEISNFSLRGAPRSFPCRHNIGYWRCEDCIGLGPSAASNRGTKRWKNIANTEEYIARIQRGESPSDFEETLDDVTRAGEYVAFGLRMTEGVSRAEFQERFAKGLLDLWRAEIEALLANGLVRWSENRLRLTHRGKLLADEVGSHFVCAAAT